MPNVFVFIREDAMGREFSVHATARSMDKALADYCRENWQLDGDPGSMTDTEVTDRYWDHQAEHGQDWYLCGEAQVEP